MTAPAPASLVETVATLVRGSRNLVATDPMRRPFQGGKGNAVTEPFTSGAELSAAFYAEVVRPLLDRRPHSAALLGWGSDVLGYDTARLAGLYEIGAAGAVS